MNKISEKEVRKLIQEAKRGSTESFSQIYTIFAERIFRYIFLKVSSKEEAEDLTQQVFIRAWESLGDFKILKNSVSSWFYTIARNLVIDFYRQQKKNFSLDDENFKIDLVNPIDLEEQLAIKEEVKKVLKFINQLPNEQRDILIWRFLDDMSYKEISKILNKTPLALRVLQFRALKHLKALMEKEERKN